MLRAGTVILNEAKNLSRHDKILRFAQNDKLLRYFCRAAQVYCLTLFFFWQVAPVVIRRPQYTGEIVRI